MSIPRMTAAEFKEQGYLLEVNRCFLHPLGLALEVVTDSDGHVTFGEVQDGRYDPEGMMFSEEAIDDTNRRNALRICEELESKMRARKLSLGFHIQPITKTTTEQER